MLREIIIIGGLELPFGLSPFRLEQRAQALPCKAERGVDAAAREGVQRNGSRNIGRRTVRDVDLAPLGGDGTPRLDEEGVGRALEEDQALNRPPVVPPSVIERTRGAGRAGTWDENETDGRKDRGLEPEWNRDEE